MSRTPDLAGSRAAYEPHAGSYDSRFATRVVAPLQRRAVAALELRPGQTVIDVACGTGLNFGALRHGVRAGGRVVGVDASDAMLERAAQRVAAERWTNVDLVASAIEDAALPAGADAALFSFVHDVLRSPVARGAGPLNALVRIGARPYVTTFEGLDAPWSYLFELVDDGRVELAYGRSMYVVVAAKPAA